MKYCPFLKLKKNELLALKELEPGINSNIVPFFDLPFNQNKSADSVLHTINTGIGHLDRHWKKDKQFYIDTYDIPDKIRIKNKHVYLVLLNKLKEYEYIPVIGINRIQEHNDAILTVDASKKISKIAIRLTPDDFDDFDLIKLELSELKKQFSVKKFDLIFDCRVIINSKRANELVDRIRDFLSDSKNSGQYERTLVTGSSIFANFSEIIKPGEYVKITQHERNIFNSLIGANSNLIYSDYCIISPEYSDANISSKIIQKVSTPKLLYTENDSIHIFRGKSLTLDERGRKQYFDLAKKIAKSNYFRGKDYSVGDRFIFERSLELINPSDQGTWYRKLINCHITYM
ncbi:beta family protein [Leptospira noguchii]|uniref:beta family protein n=1 Tax=Leptospira noguchii TaxID=28182 RepID=UPI000773F16C|nr:beta family protein [Leptospira noguchii]